MTGVEASTAIAAGFVVGTEVEVLVAEKTAPAFIAKTVPRFHAGSMHATWVTLALVAERAFPPRLASKTEECMP